MKFGKIRGKMWAKVIRFEQIWLDFGKIKILHPQTIRSFTAYGQVQANILRRMPR